MDMRRWIAIGVALIGSLVGSATASAAYWTGWISEEAPVNQGWCNAWNEAAVGMACSGSYCDSIRLRCEVLPNSMYLDSNTDYWTDYFSEEFDDLWVDDGGWYHGYWDNNRLCGYHSPYLVSGIRCSGSYCDNMSLECDLPKRSDGSLSTFSNCSWTQWFSDETGTNGVWYRSKYVVGVGCGGSYCDNVMFEACTLS